MPICNGSGLAGLHPAGDIAQAQVKLDAEVVVARELRAQRKIKVDCSDGSNPK